MVTYASLARKRPKGSWREISAFSRLGRSVGLAVEAGKRLHISLGHGSLNGLQAGSAFVGLSVLQRVAVSHPSVTVPRSQPAAKVFWEYFLRILKKALIEQLAPPIYMTQAPGRLPD